MVAIGRKPPLHWWSVGTMIISLVVSGRRNNLLCVSSEEGLAYIGGQWKPCSLQWWSVGEGLPYSVGHWVKDLHMLVVSRNNAPYIDSGRRNTL